MDITEYISKCQTIDDMTKADGDICMSASELVIKNVTVLDAEGMFKADIGIRDGRICEIGRVDITEQENCCVIDGEGLVLTCGCIAVTDGKIDRHDAEKLLFTGYSTIVSVGGASAGNSELIGELMSLPLNIGFISEICRADSSYISEAVSNGCCGLIVRNTDMSSEMMSTISERYDITISDGSKSSDRDPSESFIDEIIADRTIEPARRFGLTEHLGTVSEGKLADLYLWKPENLFSVPEKIIKCGRCIYDRSITQRHDIIYAYLNFNNRAGQNSCAVFTSETAAQGVFGEKIRPFRWVLTVSCKA